MLKRFIKVKTEYIGFHSWKDAPPKVAFLKNNHRHKFYLTCTAEVFHDDRELEFFLMQDMIETEIVPFMHLSELGSCEMQAEYILEGLKTAYGDNRHYQVEVSEDNENSAYVNWYPE